ncbi:chromo domain-like protein [Amylostereum chailletii]|nr:chromo domain-like protein [Amylostereum chailletii]
MSAEHPHQEREDVGVQQQLQLWHWHTLESPSVPSERKHTDASLALTLDLMKHYNGDTVSKSTQFAVRDKPSQLPLEAAKDETTAHGPNYKQPPPDLIDNEEEYNIEDIVDSKPTRNKKDIQYLVKWAGYPDSENTWLPCSSLSKVTDMIDTFHKRHLNAPRPVRSLGISFDNFLVSILADDITLQAKIPYM